MMSIWVHEKQPSGDSFNLQKLEDDTEQCPRFSCESIQNELLQQSKGCHHDR